MNPGQWTVITVVRCYQWTLSPLKNAVLGPGARCRFTPSCSEYALEAVRRFGAWRGARLALRRLLRCHPWGDCGHDPVPPANPKETGSTHQKRRFHRGAGDRRGLPPMRFLFDGS